jgi:hypothetical protein
MCYRVKLTRNSCLDDEKKAQSPFFEIARLFVRFDSLLFGAWRGHGFAAVAMRRPFFAHNILVDL